MGEVEASRSGPIQTKLVLVASGCDVRVAAGLHIGIDTNGHGRRRVASLDLPRGLSDQDLKFRFRFDIEEQYSGPASAPLGAVVQRLANLKLVLAHARKDDA